ATARSVLDYERLTEPLRQPLSDQAGRDVVPAARGGRYDQAHRPRRIGLRPSDARHGRKGGSTDGQMQKFPAGEFHASPSEVSNPMRTGRNRLVPFLRSRKLTVGAKRA